MFIFELGYIPILSGILALCWIGAMLWLLLRIYKMFFKLLFGKIIGLFFSHRNGGES